MKTLSIKETRNKLAEIVEKVYVANEVYVITKFGKPKAVISPFEETAELSIEDRKKILDETRGLWKDVPASKLKRKNTRYERMFD